MKRRMTMAIAIAVTAFSGRASAHYLWMEPTSQEAQLFFGEAEMLLMERSPGRLDDFQAPKAFSRLKDGTLRPVSVTRTDTSLLAPADAGDKGMCAMEGTNPVKGAKA